MCGWNGQTMSVSQDVGREAELGFGSESGGPMAIVSHDQAMGGAR